MLKISLFLLNVCVLFGLIDSKSCNSDGTLCTSFEGHGFPFHREFALNPGEGAAELTLMAAGMRKKNLFVVDVDVYTVGVYLSHAKEESVRLAYKDDDNAHDAKSLTSPIPTQHHHEHRDSGIGCGIVLHFVRDVPSNKVVDAVVEALSSHHREDVAYKAAVDHLQHLLVKSLGDLGMKTDEEIFFSFPSKEHHHTPFSVYVRNDHVGNVENKELREKIGEIYAGENAIVPEVWKILSQRLVHHHHREL